MNKKPLGDILLAMLETVRSNKGLLNATSLADLLTDQATQALKTMGLNAGDVIDVEQVRENGAPCNSVHPAPQGGLDGLRHQINTACRKIATNIGAENIGNFLTAPIEDIFSLGEKDKAAVNMFRGMGEALGELAEIQLKIPGLGPVFGRLGEILGAAGCSTCSNSRIMVETQMTRESLQTLLEFGMRHEQLQALAFEYFERIDEADREIAANIASSQTLKTNFQAQLEQARECLNSTLADSSQRMHHGLMDFHDDIHAVLNKM